MIGLGPSFLMDFEAKYLWFIIKHLGRQNDCVWVVLQKHMWEGGSEVGAVYVDTPELGEVDFLAPGAEHFKAGSSH